MVRNTSMSILFCIFLSGSLLGQSGVKIWEEPLTLPTYPVEKADLNPIFYNGRGYQGAQGHVYPYAFMDRLTDIRVPKTYQAVYVENEYIKLCVLPELGGRIFSALDKTNSYDFFYHQHVIKPALIGMLGAWISGGVEWNIPHHHRASTFMEIDHTISENPDGSKTVWVGETELRHRLKWTIGLTLYPGKSFVEATVKIFNPTPFAHSLLYWANVSVHSNENYQVIFPPGTEYYTGHGKNRFGQWPVNYSLTDKGDTLAATDVSWWKNHPQPNSLFAWNYTDDFFAGYDYGKRAGTVHVADHHIVLGKKFFLWGNNPEGAMWDRILTETDGPYLELMVGAYSDNQPDYSWINPQEARTFKQIWYPIREIDGVKNANENAAVNLETASGKTRFGFHSTSVFPSSKVLLSDGNAVLFEKTIDISPDKPFTAEVTLPPGTKPENLKTVLKEASGRELISATPVKKQGKAVPRPVERPRSPAEYGSVEELYLTGLRLEQFHNPAVDPVPYYEEALGRDSLDYRVNTALGLRLLKQGRFVEAENHLQRAMKRATKNYTTPMDGEAVYYLGVALRAQGKMEAASDAFSKAAWYNAFHSAAYKSLAELECLKGDLPKALEDINLALSTNALDPKSFGLKAVILRKLGKMKESGEAAAFALSIDPLDFLAANEKALASRNDSDRDRLNRLMRGDTQSHLELAWSYGNAGLYDEAIEVLNRLMGQRKPSASDFPMVFYTLGFFQNQKGDAERARAIAEKAATLPQDYCFPFRLEEIDVLNWSVRTRPDDARAWYDLGNLYYFLTQTDRAVDSWEKSRSLDGTVAVVHRNLGLAYARNRNNLPLAVASMEKAVACNRKDARLFTELDAFYEMAGVTPEKRLKLFEQNQNTILDRDDAVTREIALWVQLGQYDRAIHLLSQRHFHIWEGGGEIHDVYVNAHLMRGIRGLEKKKYSDALRDFEAALDYPENLEVRRSREGGRFAQIQYYLGAAQEAIGDKAKAAEFYKKSFEARPEAEWSDLKYYQALSLLKLGRQNRADSLLNGMIRYGQKQLQERVALDFFAKFGTQETNERIMADAHYLIGLGCLGKGELDNARNEFDQALKLNINHLWASEQRRQLR